MLIVRLDRLSAHRAREREAPLEPTIGPLIAMNGPSVREHKTRGRVGPFVTRFVAVAFEPVRQIPDVAVREPRRRAELPVQKPILVPKKNVCL